MPVLLGGGDAAAVSDSSPALVSAVQHVAHASQWHAGDSPHISTPHIMPACRGEEMREGDFHRAADATLEGVQELMDAFIEDQDVPGGDVEYGVRSACYGAACTHGEKQGHKGGHGPEAHPYPVT